ncbi:hypothetical protein L249_4485 [Ophiocordyceps polyrhachis-furcata BCC 54312]|uniref:Uncharacterized protein n=1 Tax=Ophiocordyceps polyrhachis-furcata BCC 54312 TaxID=1330021 RepID=A0A367L800_9HYPO|nr:hypothetical protein L249_4485 [Ophiocordyceps polyrhachis-furcata BCC 54312]
MPAAKRYNRVEDINSSLATQFKEIKRDINTAPLLFPILINSTTFIDAQADYSYNCYAAISKSLLMRYNVLVRASRRKLIVYSANDLPARDLISALYYPYS